MKKNPSNIILIGFPGIGKGQIGKLLAEKINFKYIDTQKLLVKKQNLSYQKIIEKYGFEKLLTFEENILKKYLKNKNTIIVTSGCIAFSKKAMTEAAKFSTIIYLQESQENLLRILTKTPLAFKKNKLLEDLDNRDFLYSNYANFNVSMYREEDNLHTNLIIKELQEKFKKFYQ